MKKLLSLFAAVLMVAAIFTMTISAEETNLLDPTAWVCQDDGGNPITGAAGITVGSDGKVELNALQNQWLHLVQTVTVKPATTYVFTFVCTLSEGGARVDFPGEHGPNTAAENNIRYADAGVAYGTQGTFQIEVTTADAQTELEIHVRNCTGADAEPWYAMAVGTIDSMTLTEKAAGGNDNNPDDGNNNPGTADAILICVALAAASAGAVVLVKKKH